MNHHINRAVASVLAILLVFSLVLAPAAKADIYTADSLEVALNIDGMDVSLKFCGCDDLFAVLASMTQGTDTIALNTYVGAPGLILWLNLLPEAYGIDLANYQENLKNSVFAPNSGSAYALPEETFNMLLDPTSMVSTTVNTAAFDPDVLLNVVAAVANHVEEATEIVSKNVAYSMAPDVLHLDSGDVEVTRVVVSVGPETIGEAVKSVMIGLQGDDEAKAAFAEAAEMLIAANMLTLTDDMQGVSGTQLVEALWAQLGDLADQVADIYVQADMHVTVEVDLDKVTEEPVSVAVVVSVEGQEFGASATMLSNGLLVQVQADGQTIGAQFTLDEMTDAAMTASIKLTADGQEAAVLTFNLNMAEGTFLASVVTGGETYSVGGSILAEDDAVIIRLDTVNGQPAPIGASVIIRENDMLDVPAFRDVLTMSEEEVTNLVQMGMSLAQAFGLIEAPAA